MVNNPDLAFVKNVLAVAPKVAAMVNLFLKLPKKLIGLKRKTSWYKHIPVINLFHVLIQLNGYFLGVNAFEGGGTRSATSV